jgi:hypothetical protein
MTVEYYSDHEALKLITDDIRQEARKALEEEIRYCDKHLKEIPTKWIHLPGHDNVTLVRDEGYPKTQPFNHPEWGNSSEWVVRYIIKIRKPVLP